MILLTIKISKRYNENKKEKKKIKKYDLILLFKRFTIKKIIRIINKEINKLKFRYLLSTKYLNKMIKTNETEVNINKFSIVLFMFFIIVLIFNTKFF